MALRLFVDRTLEALWDTAPVSEARFDPGSIEVLPPTARRYLSRAIERGAPLASSVRLSMTGSIRLEPGWCEFTAEQVIRWDRGFVWSARAKVRGLPVKGFDRFVEGHGEMRWKLGGIWPVLHVEGPDIDRSAAGRLHAETIWLPTVLVGAGLSRSAVRWSDHDGNRTVASIDAHGEPSDLILDVTDDGTLASCSLERWGNPDGTFAYHPFGGIVSEPRSFDGITIPTEHRVGWFFGTPRFDGDGEFFRCSVTGARFR